MDCTDNNQRQMIHPRGVAEYLRKSACLQAGPTLYSYGQPYYRYMNYADAVQSMGSSTSSRDNTLTSIDSSANGQLVKTVNLQFLSNRQKNRATLNEDHSKSSEIATSKIGAERSSSNYYETKKRITMDCKHETTASAGSQLLNSSVTQLFETVALTNNFTFPEELLSKIVDQNIENNLHINTMSRLILLFVKNGNITERDGDMARKFLALKANMNGNKLPFWEFKHAICHFARV